MVGNVYENPELLEN
ncbi:hypothetical protein ACT7DF_30600 [Bacillus cereus]